MSSTPVPFGPDAPCVDRPVPSSSPSHAMTPAVPYAAPAVTVLGSLRDLTLGGVDGGSDDGWGGAGATGSI